MRWSPPRSWLSFGEAAQLIVKRESLAPLKCPSPTFSFADSVVLLIMALKGEPFSGRELRPGLSELPAKSPA